MNKIDLVEKPYLRTDIPEFRSGDTVKVHVKVSEGGRERVQIFQGVVIARRGGGVRESFTVRKISFGVGVERVFPLHAPTIAKIEIVQHGKVRRAKLYYLRERTGRHAKIRERRVMTPVEGRAVPPEEIVPELAEPDVEPAVETAVDTDGTIEAEADAAPDAASDAGVAAAETTPEGDAAPAEAPND